VTVCRPWKLNQEHHLIAALTCGRGGVDFVVGGRRRNVLEQLFSDGLRECLARLASSPMLVVHGEGDGARLGVSGCSVARNVPAR
jgi:hypothetical protein